MINILSLGAGVQSTTVLLMSIRGELPKLDCAIFADTQWEPSSVYEHLEWLSGEAANAGIPVHRVTRGNLREDALEFMQHRASADGKRFASMPVFVRNDSARRESFGGNARASIKLSQSSDSSAGNCLD